jgi:signal transduction histidine kinase
MSQALERTSSSAPGSPRGSGTAASGPGEEAVRDLATSLPLPVLLVREGRLVWMNERLVELAGRGSASALRGTALDDLLLDGGSGLPNPQAPRAVECALRRPDGQLRTVICRPSWPDVGPKTSGWVIEDVTHVRVLERELMRLSHELHGVHREIAFLRERLRSENSEREDLLNVVSHELRTPVTVISGYNRLLLREEVGPLNAEQRRFLEESEKGCRRLDAFLGNLMEASRRTRGGEVLEVCNADLEPVIEGVVELMRPMLQESGLEIEVRVGDDARRARFDRLRVEQVLTNLLGNAIKYTRAGGTIEVSTRPLPRAEGPGPRWVEIAVADDGPGVAPADRVRIFEPYVQAGEESRAGGLGLGLAICKRLVEAHGGTIGVGVRTGGGSRFAFTLPESDDVATGLDLDA